jgi:hypothetical protein
MEAGLESGPQTVSLALARQIKHALGNLSPADVREEAARPVTVGILASSPETLGRMEAFLAPPHMSAERRAEALRCIIRGANADVVLCEAALLVPPGAFSFDPELPEACIRRVLKARPELMLPLARRFYPFRQRASQKIVRDVAQENALFCLATAIPDVVPSVFSLPWAVGAYSSDAIFLTVNQIRMSFLLAAASDRPVGYREQRSEIASILASSFGWRALARELVGKIPLGGGLIPKAAIAWAGTFALGLSMERLYRLGYGFSREERAGVYKDAFQHGKEVARLLLTSSSSPSPSSPPPAT